MQNILLNSALKDPFETQDEPSLDSITFSNVDINKGDLTNYREQLLSPVTNLSVSMSINQTASDPRMINGSAKVEVEARAALRDVRVERLIAQPNH